MPARPHKLRCVSDFLNVDGIRTIAWPACSPDINPIEYVWDMLGRRLRSRTPAVQNTEQVAAALVEIWDNLPQDMIDNVIRSMRSSFDQLTFKHPPVYYKAQIGPVLSLDKV